MTKLYCDLCGKEILEKFGASCRIVSKRTTDSSTVKTRILDTCAECEEKAFEEKGRIYFGCE